MTPTKCVLSHQHYCTNNPNSPNPTFLATAAPLLGSEVLAATIELDGVVPPPVVIADNVVVGVILSTAIVLVPNKSVKLVTKVGFMLMTVSCSSY
jgi:hypothetical protein